MAKLGHEQLDYLNDLNFLKEYLLILNSRFVYSNNLIEEDNGPIDKLYDPRNVLTLSDNFKAFYLLLNRLDDDNPRPLDEELIIKVANTINKHAMYISDNYRTNTYQIKFEDKFPMELSGNIQSAMKKLLDNYYGEWVDLDIFEREARFNIEFLRIHPFGDGNGRTSRLLLNFNMLRQGHAPIIIPEEKREKYFKARNRENVEWIRKLFVRESEKELEVINKLIADYNEEKKDYTFVI